MISMTAIMALASLASAAASAAGAGKTQGGADQVNPYTDEYYSNLIAELSQASANQQLGVNKANTATGNMNRLAGDMAGTVDDISNLQQPGAMDWFEDFLGSVPEYMGVSKQAGKQFTETAGRSIQEQARVNSAQAVSDVAASFAGKNAFSGAAASAIGAGAAKPFADAQASLTSKQADIGSNTFNNLSNTGQNLAFQGNQNEFLNSLQALMSTLSGQQAQTTTYGNVANAGLSEAQIAAAQASSIRNAQADVAQPVYQQNAGEDPFGTMSQLFAGGSGVSDMIGPNTSQGNSSGGGLLELLQGLFGGSNSGNTPTYTGNAYDWRTKGGGVQ